MEVYFYSENNKKPVFLGDSREYQELLEKENPLTACNPEKIGDFSGSCLCLGYFDGVHLAHRAIFERARECGKWGVLLFDRNVKGMPLLTTQYEKIKLISEFMADYVVIAEFSEAFMNRTPEEFADFLKDALKVSRVLAGYDYRFGRNAAGDAKALERLARERGILPEIADARCVGGKPIKSTEIRNRIKAGDVPGANELLGYPYMVSGIVEKGLGNGHKLGFPTANVAYDSEKLLPPDGVYSGRAFGNYAVINIGKNPTFNAEKRTLEVHIPDFSEDLYGKVIEVSFLEKIREDIKFETKEALIRQIEKDIEFVKGR